MSFPGFSKASSRPRGWDRSTPPPVSGKDAKVLVEGWVVVELADWRPPEIGGWRLDFEDWRLDFEDWRLDFEEWRLDFCGCRTDFEG